MMIVAHGQKDYHQQDLVRVSLHQVLQLCAKQVSLCHSHPSSSTNIFLRKFPSKATLNINIVEDL